MESLDNPNGPPEPVAQVRVLSGALRTMTAATG